MSFFALFFIIFFILTSLYILLFYLFFKFIINATTNLDMTNTRKKTCKGKCKIEASDETSTCFVCNNTFHQKCTNLTQEILHVLQNNSETGAVWICSTCRISDRYSTKKELEEIKLQISSFSLNINNRLLALENKLDGFSPKHYEEKKRRTN